jgi:hypothetical protein
MELLLFIVVILAIGTIVFLGRLLKMKDEEIAFSETILELINDLNKSFDWKYSKQLDTIITYVLFAFQTVQDTNDEQDKQKVFDLVLDRAKEVCAENGIIVTESVVDILEKLVKIVIGKYL